MTGDIIKSLGMFTFRVLAVIALAITLGVYIVIAIGAAITGAALQKH